MLLPAESTVFLNEGKRGQKSSSAMCSEYVKGWCIYFVATWAFLETFLLAGYKVGWAILVYVLKKDGIYSSLCHVNNTTPVYASITYSRDLVVINNTTRDQYDESCNSSSERPLTSSQPSTEGEDTGCPEQDDMFELCVTIYNITSTFVALATGQMNFLYGIRTTRIFSIYVVATWAFLETFLLPGYYTGWASLVYIFKKEGMYAFLCHSTSHRHTNSTASSNADSTHGTDLDLTQEHKVSLSLTPERPLNMEEQDTGCSEQDAIFELCVTICSVVLPVVSLFMGHINFVFGIRPTRIVSITLLVLGSAMFVGISKDTPWMMFIGYLALANGGMGILQTNNQVSYMFEKGGPIVIGLICGAFDASGAVMLGVKLAYDNGVSLQMSFIVIGCLNIMAVISTFTFLPKKFIKNNQTNSNTGADHEADVSERANHAPLNIKNESSEKTMLLRDKSRSLTLHDLKSEVSETRQGIETYPTAEEGNHVATKGDVSGMKEDKEKSKNSLLLGYIFSPLYMMTVVWSCVIQLIFVLFIGSFNAWLEHITHHVQERVSVLTDFMFTVMLISPVVSVLSGAMVALFYSIQPETRSHKTRTHYALAAPIALTNFLALILCACVVVEREDMTYITVITSVLYRTLLYISLTLFSRLMYPSEYFSAICGVLFTICGLVDFLQYPLFLWCQSSPSGYRQVYGMLGLASILISVQPIYLIYTGYREIQ